MSDEITKTEDAVSVPEKFKKLIEEIEKMSVIDLHELVKTLETKFGVSASAVAAPAAGAGAAVAEEKDSYSVNLASVGEQKIAVMKAVKEVLGLGLKEAKDLVDGAPPVLKEGVKKAEAEEMKKRLKLPEARSILK